MYVPSRAALIEILKKDGTLSLSLYLYLSRSGWFHDEVAKKADKTQKKAARSLAPSLGYGCQLTFVAIVRLKGTCNSYRAGTTGSKLRIKWIWDDQGTGPRPNIRLTTYLDLVYWSMHDRVRWERPRQARAGPCRPGLLTALPHRVSIRYWLHGTSVLQVGSYYAIEPCTIHNFTLAHGS